MNQHYFRKQTFQGLKHYALSGCSRPARFLFLFSLALCFAFTPEAMAQITPQFQKQGGVSPSRNGFPLNSTGVKRHQNFYYANELTGTAPGNAPQAISGLITRVYFRAYAASTGTYTNFKVNLGQTTANSFPGAGNNEFFPNLTNVYTNPSQTLTASAAGEWMAINLTTPYLYDAGQPLIVEIEMTAKASGGIDATTSSGPTNRRVYTSTANAVNGSTDKTWLDFGIDVSPTPPCSGQPTTGTAIASVSYICPNTNFNLDLVGPTVGTDITHQWQSSPDGVSNWTNIAGANTSSLETSQANTNYYRAITTCGGVSTTSNSVLVTTTPAPFTGVYTINKNAPFTPNSNYTSFADLIQDLTCRGVSGSVTVNLVPGSGPYNEQVIIPAIPGASAANTITFNGNGDTLKFAVSSSNRSLFRLDGADFITINNFKLVTTSTSYGWGVQFSNGADNNTISNNTILLDGVTSTTEASSAGIAFTSSNTDLKAGNNGNNSQILNNTISGGYKGIHLMNTNTPVTVSSNQVKNNTIRNFYAAGIVLDAAKGTVVENNDFSRPTRTATTSVTVIELKNGTTGSTISRNRIHNTHDAVSTLTGSVNGIYLNSTDAIAGEENIIKNNLIYNINNTGTTYGIYNSGSDGSFIYNNTIVLDGANTNAVRGFYQTTTAQNIKFNNNLIYLGGSGTGARHAIYLANTSSVISNNNAYYIDPALTSAVNLGYFGIAYPTLADWQTANSGAFDQHSVFANPLFSNVATGDFQPTNSMLNDLGVALAAVTDDINGVTRSNNPDPGAYEFTPIGNDAGILALVSPANPAVPGTTQNVEVTIKNYGTSLLTSMVINWSVNGTTQTPFNWTGSLAGGQVSAPVTIGTYNFAAGSYTLNFCTASPNGTTDSNLANDCFDATLSACLPLAGTYTIDKNAQVSATNFQSISAAAQALNNCGVSGPVTINVVTGSGPYTEQVELLAIAGTSATNTVTFNGNGNKVTFAPTTNNRSVFRLDGTDFVTLTNFAVETSDLVFGWGIHLMNGADNNTISNNTINIASTSTTEFYSVGIVLANATTAVSVLGYAGNNNVISGNTISGGYKGIHLNGDLNQPGNNQVVNNTIRDFYSDGIKLNAIKGTLVEGNDISRPTRDQISTFTGISVAGNSQLSVISKNRIHNTHDAAVTSTALASDVYGIYFVSNDAPVGSENIVKNNLIYNTNNTDVIYGFYNAGSDGVFYYNNSMDLSNADNTGTVRGFYQTTLASNIKFVNNIVNITSTGGGTKYGLDFNATTSGITSNNNVINVPVGNTGRFGTNNFLTLANWKGANSNAYDQNSVAVNPLFINAATGNLKPNALGIDNMGQALAAVTDDINGAPRSTTTPDVGAYEFSVPVDNVGIIAISGPADNCGLSAQERITVTIKNFGTSVQTTIPVTYSVNGTPIATETYTGSLAYNATATFTFAATANLSASGSYTIVAATLLPGDNTPANDSDTLKVTNSLMPSGNISLDFETPANGLDALRKVTNARSAVKEDTAASHGPASTKGIIMDGVGNTAWLTPTGVNGPWISNPEHFAGVYMCFTPAPGGASDSLILRFDLKQLYKDAQANTNFRVTVNGQQIGKTYMPPFAGYPAGVDAPWTTISVNLSAFLNQPTIQIGLESSVREAYANGTGTANLIDNINVQRYSVTTGVKDSFAASAISVYPNPNNGNFNVKLNGLKQAATLQVYNLAGQLMATETVKAGQQEANMNLHGLAAGTYLLKVTAENNVKVTRLIVQ